uniref:Serine protease inhibitor Kazal-type 1-like n=1 Tax=Geotrypetes seraphini TaxID=260995 RepID=A0A6P8Q6D9_GEOSA|nr:serine protease inhibitor Kazal-type 1-like [Geotrypetes seraphini]
MRALGSLLFLLICLFPGYFGADADEGREANCEKFPRVGCPKIYSPVCGTDGIVYDNECLICHKNREKNLHIRIRKEGKC